MSSSINPYHDQYLLIWNEADRYSMIHQTYLNTNYRIMNSDGTYLFKKRKMPKNFRFHTAISPVFNPVAKNFFVAYVEHKILYQGMPFRALYGAKIWVTNIDSLGNISIPEFPGQKAFPLTDVFTDKLTATRLNQVIYNPIQNEYLVVFSLFNTSTFMNVDSEIWGMIVKAN